MAAGRGAWTETRRYLQQLLSTGSLTNVEGYVLVTYTCRNIAAYPLQIASDMSVDL